jgi:predicted CopG family antitoxin
MGKAILITEDVYARLLALKKERGKKSFTEIIRSLTLETRSKDLLLHELNDAYKELKKIVVGNLADGMFVGLIDRTRVITLNLAQMDSKDRPPYILKVEEELDKLMVFTAPPKEK